jgi:hypothetical protein
MKRQSSWEGFNTGNFREGLVIEDLLVFHAE